MSDQIEMHDSFVTAEQAQDALVLRLCPAYVHHWIHSPHGWRGEGRSQDAELRVLAGVASGLPEAGRVRIADAWLQVGGQVYRNMIPVPLDDRAPVRGHLTFVNAPPLRFQGVGISVRVTGSPTRIELLPPEWAPGGAAG